MAGLKGKSGPPANMSAFTNTARRERLQMQPDEPSRSNSSEIRSQIEKKHEMALDDKLRASARNIERAPATGLEIDPLI